jgi:hypothetical protein
MVVHRKEDDMDEDEKDTLHALVEYYRNKCVQLEFDFVQYQIKTQRTIKSLQQPAGTDNKSKA